MFNNVFKSGIYAHYSVSSTPTFTSTPWLIYDAKNNKTKQKCSLFKFDKKLFEQFVHDNSSNSFSSISKTTYKLILSETIKYVKAYVSTLIKFKHPNILSVIEPLEERQSSMIFVTERVTENLANFLKEDKNKQENELLIINGLSQVSEALIFLHNNANSIHLNLIPSSIFITEKLDFKLSGFNFAESYESSGSSYNFLNPDDRFPSFLSINLDYSDPTLIIDKQLGYFNDIFSMGCIIYQTLNVMNPGKKLISSNNDMYDYKAGINKLKTGNGSYKFADEFLNNNFDKLINLNPNFRVGIEEFKNSSFFNNELVNSLDFINNFESKTLVEKDIFLKGFNSRNFYQRFPKFILIDKFLPILKETFSNVSNLVIFPVALTGIFKISPQLSNLMFTELLVEILKPLTIKSNGKKFELNIISFTEIQSIIIENLKVTLEKLSSVSPTLFRKAEKSFLVPLMNHVLADGAISIEQLQTEANNNAIQNVFNTVKTLGQVSPEKLKIQERFLSNLSLIIATLQKQSENENSNSNPAGSLNAAANTVTNMLTGKFSAINFIESELFPKISKVFKTTGSMTIRLEILNNYIHLTKDRIVAPGFSSKQIIPILIGIKQKNNQQILQKLYDYYSIYLDQEELFDKNLFVETIIPELLKLSFQNNELTIIKFNEFFALLGNFQIKLKEKHTIYLEKYNAKNIVKKNNLESALAQNDGSPVNSPGAVQAAATFDSLINKGPVSNGANINDIKKDDHVYTNSRVATPLADHGSTAIFSVSSPTMAPLKATSKNIMHNSTDSSIPAMMPSKISSPSLQPPSLSNSQILTPKPASITQNESQSSNKQKPSLNNSQILMSNPNLDWSLESTKLNAGKLTLASNNVLKPKLKSPSLGLPHSSVSGGLNLAKKSESLTNLPPGFSSGLIQPMKPSNASYASKPDQFKKRSDDFFDSFL